MSQTEGDESGKENLDASSVCLRPSAAKQGFSDLQMVSVSLSI